MNMPLGSLTLATLLPVLRRRFWLAMATGGGVFALMAGIAAFLPNVYSASALLVLESQDPSVSVVPSLGNASAETRLNAISRDVLSDARLEKLIRDFGLTKEQPARLPGDVIDSVRKAIVVDVTKGRRDGALTFNVSFTGADPRQVTEITNALASSYVEHTGKLREYKERHPDELPGQVDADTKAAHRLREQVQALQEDLGRKRGQRAALVGQTTTKAAAPNGSMAALKALTDQVITLQQRLEELRSRYAEGHPDIEQTQQELGELEARVNFRAKRAAGQGERRSPVDGVVAAQLRALDSEIERIEGERKKLQQDLAIAQQRIDNASQRALKPRGFTHDNNGLQEQRSAIVGRQEEATLTGLQPGESVRLLAPAAYPSSPLGPRRSRLLLAGLVLGLGAAIGGVVVWEKFIDPAFHNAAELAAATGFPVLVSIPRIAAPGEQNLGVRRHLVSVS